MTDDQSQPIIQYLTYEKDIKRLKGERKRLQVIPEKIKIYKQKLSSNGEPSIVREYI